MSSPSKLLLLQSLLKSSTRIATQITDKILGRSSTLSPRSRIRISQSPVLPNLPFSSIVDDSNNQDSAASKLQVQQQQQPNTATVLVKIMDLVSRINANHQTLVDRLSTLESIVRQQTNNSVTNNNDGDSGSGSQAQVQARRNLPTEAEIEAERLRLTAENEALRKQVQQLVRQLTSLEVAIKGEEEVAPLHLLPNQQQSNNKSSVSTTTPVSGNSKPQQQQQQKQQSETVVKPQQQQKQQQKAQGQQQQQQQPPKAAQQPQSAPVPKGNKENQAPASKQDKKKQANKGGGGAKPEGGESTNTTNKGAPPPKKETAPTPEPEKLDASRLDLRVGRIITCAKHPDADSLYVEQIDCGEEKPRTVVSGLVKFVPLEQMQQRLVVVLCNLKPAKMRGVLSEAMVMCASTPEKVEILSPPEGAVPGDRVSFDKYPGTPDSQLNPKKKIWEQIAPDLATNGELLATYKGDPFVVVGKGPVKAETLKNVIVK